MDAISSIRLLPIPAQDLALRLFSSRALDGARTFQGLQRRLRVLFPEVRVRPQHELAAIGMERGWYVFRDRFYQPQSLRDWEHDDGSGRVGSHRHGAAFRPVGAAVQRLFLASEGAGDDARPTDLASAFGATAPSAQTGLARGEKREPRELGGMFT
jgi:hypothetical protein